MNLLIIDFSDNHRQTLVGNLRQGAYGKINYLSQFFRYRNSNALSCKIYFEGQSISVSVLALAWRPQIHITRTYNQYASFLWSAGRHVHFWCSLPLSAFFIILFALKLKFLLQFHHKRDSAALAFLLGPVAGCFSCTKVSNLASFELCLWRNNFNVRSETTETNKVSFVFQLKTNAKLRQWQKKKNAI